MITLYASTRYHAVFAGEVYEVLHTNGVLDPLVYLAIAYLGVGLSCEEEASLSKEVCARKWLQLTVNVLKNFPFPLFHTAIPLEEVSEALLDLPQTEVTVLSFPPEEEGKGSFRNKKRLAHGEKGRDKMIYPFIDHKYSRSEIRGFDPQQVAGEDLFHPQRFFPLHLPAFSILAPFRTVIGSRSTLYCPEITYVEAGEYALVLPLREGEERWNYEIMRSQWESNSQVTDIYVTRMYSDDDPNKKRKVVKSNSPTPSQEHQTSSG